MEKFRDLKEAGEAREKVYVVFAGYDGPFISYLTDEDWETAEKILTTDISKAAEFGSVEDAFVYMSDLLDHQEILDEQFAYGEEIHYSVVTEDLLKYIAKRR